jgi:hypothetical protein
MNSEEPSSANLSRGERRQQFAENLKKFRGSKADGVFTFHNIEMPRRLVKLSADGEYELGFVCKRAKKAFHV